MTMWLAPDFERARSADREANPYGFERRYMELSTLYNVLGLMRARDGERHPWNPKWVQQRRNHYQTLIEAARAHGFFHTAECLRRELDDDYAEAA
jgi:hypothetical protein